MRPNRRRCLYKARRAGLLFTLVFLLLILVFTSSQEVPTEPCASCARTSYEQVELVYQSQGQWFTTVVHPIVDYLFQTQVGREVESSSGDSPIQRIVVESVPSFQALDDVPCRYKDEHWLQVVGEARKNYDNDAWCPHATSPMLRMDTVLPSKPSTFTFWVPYVCNYIIPNKLKLRQRYFHDFDKRPHLLAWISSNCIDTRVNMWRALKRTARKRNIRGLHSLGHCEKDTSLKRNTGWTSNDEIYRKYKFVLAMENTVEPGYVSEKIAIALAAGAIPIYHGDTLAARYIFNETSFVSLSAVWRHLEINSAPEELTTSEWDRTATALLDLMTDSTQIKELLIEDTLAVHSQVHPPYDALLPSSCIAYNNNGKRRMTRVRELLRLTSWTNVSELHDQGN